MSPEQGRQGPRGLEFPAEPGQDILLGSLCECLTRDLRVATPKSVPQSLISLKVSLRDLTGEFDSVHPSPLLDFLDGACLGSPPLFWLGPLLCANTLLCLLSHHCLRTFWVLCSLHSFFLHEGISLAPFFPDCLYTHLHVSHLSSGPSIQLPVLTSSFYFSRTPQTQHVPHS